jgi:hypothetical protein
MFGARNHLGVAAVVVLALTSHAFAQHDGDVWVGRTAAGQLIVSPSSYVPAENFKDLFPVSGLLKGWTDDDPGFDRLVDAEPEADVYPLEPGVEVWIEVLWVEPAFRLIDNSLHILDEPGEQSLLGDHTLHVHPTWHINSNDPLFDPEQCVWQGAFVLRDFGSTNYEDSEPLVFSFTNVELREADGDFEENGTVDVEDWTALAECMAGPEVLPEPDDPEITTCVVECLNAFDFDVDGDVDIVDVGVFTQLFSD